MFRPFQIATAALALITATKLFAQASLSKDSPFLPTAGSAPAPATLNETLSLVGLSGEGKAALICLYDTATKSSYLIPVGSTLHGIEVVSCDFAQDQVTLLVGGQQKLLTLQKPRVANGASSTYSTPPISTAAVAPTSTPGIPQPMPAPGTTAHQEMEARMLVSDLLEIGMQQRKAYEEKQREAAATAASAEKKKS